MRPADQANYKELAEIKPEEASHLESYAELCSMCIKRHEKTAGRPESPDVTGSAVTPSGPKETAWL